MTEMSFILLGTHALVFLVIKNIVGCFNKLPGPEQIHIVQCHLYHMTEMSFIPLWTLVFLGCVTNLVWGVIYRLHLWFFSCTASLKDSAQFGQGYDQNPVWILKCVFRLYDCLNDLVHCEHLNGFSSVWILICLFKVLSWLNDLVHSEQL